MNHSSATRSKESQNACSRSVILSCAGMEILLDCPVTQEVSPDGEESTISYYAVSSTCSCVHDMEFCMIVNEIDSVMIVVVATLSCLQVFAWHL